MKRKWLAIGISTVSVIILILASLTNVIGYQLVQTSQQNIIKERINQRELLFQTIVDIANNKEIQRIILKSQISRGVFPKPEIPVITKTQIKQIYFIGLILSKIVSKSRIQSMIGKYQFNNQEIQQEINSVIEKDKTLISEITQLKDSDCDCEIDNTLAWPFPIICTTLFILFLSLVLPISIHYQLFEMGITFGDIITIIVFGIAILFTAVYFSAALISCNWAVNLWPKPY